jgi:hypothetical protein
MATLAPRYETLDSPNEHPVSGQGVLIRLPQAGRPDNNAFPTLSDTRWLIYKV